MAIELQGDEGEVSVIDFSRESEVEETANTEDVAETTEEVTEEVISEEVALEEAETTVDEAGTVETYSQDEVMELMKIHEQKIVEEIQRSANAAKQPAETATETKKAPAHSELVNSTLDEVLNSLGDEDLISGADLKNILKKTFTTMNSKAEQFTVEAENAKFNNAAGLYQQKYVPGIIAKYGIDLASRDAKFIQNSFLETLTVEMQKGGRTEAAAKAAATKHILAMTKEFGQAKTATKPAATATKTVMIDKKLASGNTGSEPTRPKTTGVDPNLAKRIETGKASTAELLKVINSRK